MATVYNLHPQNPQRREIDKIVDALRKGAVMLYPTDTVYAIGCDINSKSAVEKVRRIKQLSNDKPLTFLCPSLSNIAQYAVVTDSAYRLMKHLIPGPYTFVLPATKLVPKLVQDPKRRTTGIRVPDSVFCLTLLEALGNPIISASAHILDENSVSPTLSMEKAKLFDSFDKVVDTIVDDDSEQREKGSTILDLTDSEPIVVREGLGWEEVNSWLTA